MGILQGIKSKDYYSLIHKKRHFEESNYSHLFWQLVISMVPCMWSFCTFRSHSKERVRGMKGIPKISHPKSPCYLQITQMHCNLFFEGLIKNFKIQNCLYIILKSLSKQYGI